MAISAPKTEKRVKAVWVDDDRLTVDLMDGRTIAVPLAWYPRLFNATPEQRLLRDNQNHARCDNQASLPAVSVFQRKLHPGIMMSGCQAGVKPGPLGPRLWRLRA